MMVEIVEKQNAIIAMQTGIIDELFEILMQYLTPEETGNLPCLEEMKQAAEMRKEVESADEWREGR